MSRFCRTSALAVEGVTKSHGALRALASVSARVARGEGVALCGPNGAGKSTLLSVLAGIVRPDLGTVQVFGVPPWKRDARRALGFVPQELALYPELTGTENVALFGRLCGMRSAALREGVRSALATVGLHAVASQRASTYSGGMCRRLSIACALVHAPALLLLDEPFVGVDARARDQLIAALVQRKRAGVTIVLSTHAREEALALCDRVLDMERGEIVRDEPLRGPPLVRSVRSGRAVMEA